MKATTTFTATILLAMASNVFSTAGVSTALGRYSFDYALMGDGRSRPIQVFDNGEKTYLQFPKGVDIPAFFSVDGSHHFVPGQEGPYITIDGVPRDFVAQMGLSRTRITHANLATTAVQTSPSAKAVLPPVQAPARAAGVQLASIAPVAIGSRLSESARVPNSWMDNSYAQPRRGDEVVWTGGASAKQHERAVHFVHGKAKLTREGTRALSELARAIDGAVAITVVGRDDDSDKEGLGEARARVLTEALVRGGVQRELIREKTAASNDAAVVRKGKDTLVASVVRWVDAVPVQARAAEPTGRQVPAAQLDLARQLAEGLISPSDALERIRKLVPRDPAQQSAAPQVAEKPAAGKWEIRQGDGTLEGMLQRWGNASGWKVLSKGAPEVRINGAAEFESPEFIKAAEYAVAQAKQAGYRIKATAYSNKVLVLSEEESK